MAKRELMVSKQINKVISNGPVGSVLLYTLANEKMAARNFAATTYEKLYCTKKYCELPIVGCWFITNGTRSVENIINIKPDLIISAGNITRNTIENTQEDQRLMDIPIAIISTEFTELPLSYSLLGDLLNEQEKAKELIDFYNKYIPGIIHKTSLIPDNEKKRVYLAIGDKGLTTAPKASIHSQVIKYAGGINVAQTSKKMGHMNVSLEQIIEWNPDVVLTCGVDNKTSIKVHEKLLNDKKWQSISAVIHNNIYTVPSSPYTWIDMPPSANQIIGLIWLSNILYPELFSFNMEEITKEFYQKFYHVSLNNKDITYILNGQLKEI
jgi:iron complex transport system substrate-binding protein